MNHQGELEKKKYRNWVRGVLAYKYLKEGIEAFADEVVQQDHYRILNAVSPTPRRTCNQCYLGNLRPLHKCEKDPVTGRNKCPWGQSNCNCLFPKKHPCLNNVCGMIMEVILKSHGSTPPTPNWKNTDIQKWCSSPWEIAKCFINAPGYSDKTQAADMDTPGLLHVFINNINLQSHLSDSINGSDTFKKTLQRRNELFHSPTMEMEDSKLNECIDEIIAILEDEKELKARHDAQQAVLKLKQLKQESFIITTYNEAEVCRDSLASITKQSEELKQTIQDAKDDIRLKQTEAKEEIDDKANECRDAVVSITNQSTAELKHTIQDAKDDIGKKQTEAKAAIDDKAKECRDAVVSITNQSAAELKQTIKDAKDDIGQKQTEAKEAIGDKANECRDAVVSITNQSAAELKQTIQDAKDDISNKQTEAKEAIGDKANECRDAVALVTNKSAELEQTIKDAQDDIEKKQTEVTKVIEDRTRTAIQELDRHSDILHERVGRLESRLSMLESKVDELDTIRQNHQKQLEYVEGKQVLQKKLVELYQSHYVNTSITPLKLQESNINIQDVYVAPEMVVEEKPGQSATTSVENATNKPNIRPVTGYRDILQTSGQKHKQVYIVGDVGTGKSTFSRMMMQNWCSAITAGSLNDTSKDSLKSKDEYEKDNDYVSLVNDGNINEMRNYDLLFFVPLQRMSGLSDITEMIKAILTTADIASKDFIDKIFEQESESCLIVADGLDEWTPPKGKSVLQPVSYGLPNRARAKHAIVVTLSRPSAEGILNMRSSECDQKVELLGINAKSVVHFTKTYLTKLNKKGRSYEVFMEKINSANVNHLEKTPLLLQQLVWLYGNGIEVGKSTSDTYSHLLNIILGWSKKREEGDDIEGQNCDTKQDKDMILPRLLQRFPRCEETKGFLLPLARVAFEALTSETGSGNFGRSHLQQKGVPNEAIDAVIKLGLLVENNCFDPTLEYTQLEFIHISYLEFLAAVYVSSHFNEHNHTILSNTVLQDLFQKCKSAADVLHLSNVLKMICGLSPFLIAEISKLVSDIVSGDESMIRYRNSLPEYWYGYWYMCYHVSVEIQRLILNCLSECDSDDQPMVSLCDVTINSSTTNMSILQRIIPENVLSLRAVRIISGVEVWGWIARLTRLQYMYIAVSKIRHSEIELVSSFIQEAPLKYLSLDRVICNYSCCNGHKIDLSKHDQLQKLELTNCRRVIFTNINTKYLETVRLDSSSISIIDCLLNAGSLTEFVLRNTLWQNTGYDERVNNVVHTLHKLRKLKLEHVYIADSDLTVTPEMRNLEHIDIKYVSMSQQTWCTFVDSLLTLQQSVQVDLTCSFSGSRWIDEDKLTYVKRNTMIMCEVMQDDWAYFCFKTKK